MSANNVTRAEVALIIYRLQQNLSTGNTFGRATYYAGRFNGQNTASGEKYDSNLLTAAHRSLPFGTKVKVTNLSNGQNVTVTINDRGPYVNGMIIDLSSTAFEQIAKLSTGLANVEIQILPTE